jgi:hypothetical protein
MIVIAAVVAAAMLLPLKHIDFIRVGPFSSADVTLAQCGKPMGMRGSEYERHAQDRIQLTFTHPTMRQAIQDIERQTGMKVHVAGCGTGMSLMSGSWPMGCSLDPCRVP